MNKELDMNQAIASYVENLQLCIVYEQAEEMDRLQETVATSRNIQKQALGFCDLILGSCDIGVYGSVLLNLTPEDCSPLPASQIGIGDLVAISAKDIEQCKFSSGGKDLVDISGFVESITGTSITIAVDKFQPSDTLDQARFVARKLPNNITYNRLKAALKRMIALPRETKYMTDILFGNKKLEQQPIPLNLLNSDFEISFCNTCLNSAQKSAIEFALTQKDFAIIHGPPGTGKTTVLAELIHQLTKSGEKVLVCAPTNIAVDNIMLKALDYKIKAVRLGHPSRLSHNLVNHTVDGYVRTCFPSEPLNEAKMELKRAYEKLITPCTKQERAYCRSEIGSLRQEIKQREQKVTKEALLAVNCVFVTLTSAHRDNLARYFADGFFTTVIIDECSQALDPACWMAIPYAKRCILAGDHCQLAPVILSNKSLKLGLGKTLMERAIENLGNECFRLLSEQFRMNNEIMSWVSHESYGDQLTADPRIASQFLMDLPCMSQNEYTSSALMMVDTSGCGLTEHSYHSSYGNMGESDIVAFIVNQLVHSGLDQEDIAVITPYKRQVDIIKGSLDALGIVRVEVQTVDGFQGREKEAVLLSLVRSNPGHEIGFLADKRRMNVAVSRARRFVCVLADGETVKSDPTCASLISHIRHFGDMRSGFEYTDELSSATLTPNDKKNMSAVFEDAEKMPPADIPYVAMPPGDIPYVAMPPADIPPVAMPPADIPPVAMPPALPTLRAEEMMGATKPAPMPTVDLTVEFRQMVLDDRTVLIEVDSSLHAFDKLKSLGQGEENKSYDATADAILKEDLAPYIRILTKFKKSDEDEYKFHQQFNSYQRMCVHIAAERLGLIHFSVGEGEDRYVIVQKLQPPIPIEAADDVVNSEITKLLSTKSKKKKPRGKGFKELSCDVDPDIPRDVDPDIPRDINPDMPPEGADLVREALPESVTAEETTNTGPRNSRRSRRGKKKICKEPENKVDSSDELLDELVKLSNVCSSPSCKESVKLIGEDCLFCRHRFCIKHMLPEVHGCGQKAKEAARKAFVKPPPKPLSKEKKKALKTSLNKKLSEKSSTRKGVNL